MSWLLSDCPYDYCGHMTVTGFVIKVTVDTSGFVPTGLPYEREEVDTIDPFEELVLLFKDIPRNPSVGDEDVDCSSIDEVRVGEAGNQAGLRSEEHTSELQSRGHLVCRLLLVEEKTEPNMRVS